jgi:hypothetical protein
MQATTSISPGDSQSPIIPSRLIRAMGCKAENSHQFLQVGVLFVNEKPGRKERYKAFLTDIVAIIYIIKTNLAYGFDSMSIFDLGSTTHDTATWV